MDASVWLRKCASAWDLARRGEVEDPVALEKLEGAAINYARSCGWVQAGEAADRAALLERVRDLEATPRPHLYKELRAERDAAIARASDWEAACKEAQERADHWQGEASQLLARGEYWQGKASQLLARGEAAERERDQAFRFRSGVDELRARAEQAERERDEAHAQAAQMREALEAVGHHLKCSCASGKERMGRLVDAALAPDARRSLSEEVRLLREVEAAVVRWRETQRRKDEPISDLVRNIDEAIDELSAYRSSKP